MTTKVLMSPGRTITNPFVGLLIDHLMQDIEVSEFNWKKAFSGEYDIMHVHWPESLIRADSKLRTLAKCLLFILLIGLNKLRGRKNVWTVHNLTAHERSSSVEKFALRIWRSSCHALVFMSKTELFDEANSRHLYIPHGDYSPIIDMNNFESPPHNTGRILLFGFLRPYKGIERLLEAFTKAEDLKSTLRIVGRPISNTFGRSLIDLMHSSPHISYDFRSLSDQQLLNEINQAEMVILPYKRIYNSGAALMALSASCPIVVTASPTMLELQREVGSDWVQMLEGDLTATSLTDAVCSIRAGESNRLSSRPSLTARDWSSLGATYSLVYRDMKH
ncbi:hypothetical protein [Arthrobacter sp. S39]|uniref:hypothetical protein n=1 Tax=Arthrobacter sp. S39 TaxID=2509720 RepID=UPI0010376F57|nr:hypothetical protein [Arthrobacter sp. S39]TAP39119.1 hypothetical protein EYS21_22630 [Arthrobacter sp. S39]